MRNMPDYNTLLDDETRAFVARTESLYDENTTRGGVDAQRANYDAMCAKFRMPRPDGIATQDLRIAAVYCRKYTRQPSDISVIYLHGGGFVVGGLDSHDDVCAEICASTGFAVISVDYRLSPEHLHPAAYEDALTVAQAVNGPIILAGDSAGATLCASVVQTMRHETRLLGQVLIYPYLGGDSSKGSYVTHADAPLLTTKDMEFYANCRGEPPQDDPTYLPLMDRDFSNLPPTRIFSAECDPLSDDGKHYAQALNAAGVDVQFHLEKGLVHGYLRARHSVQRARASFEAIVTAIKDLQPPAPDRRPLL